MARPRTFEPEDALAAIKDAFWRLGYEAASLQDIEAATGLKKQSLYRLFGDKRGMYLSAIEHYGRTDVAAAAAILGAGGSAEEKFQLLFDHMIDAAIDGTDRRGCFLCNASIDQAPVDVQTQKLVAELMDRIRETFAEALSVSPPYGKDAARREAKAAHLMSSYFGLRVMIRAGLPAEVLRAAANEAIAAI